MQPDITALLATYPRTRPPLTSAHQQVYEAEYKKTRGENKPLTSRVSSGISTWMHRKVASVSATGAMLEIGAGTLNHVPFEKGNSAYDVVEPFTALYHGNPLLSRLRNIYPDIRNVPADTRYQRIFSVAALEHLIELPYCIAKSGLLLEKGGIFQAGIPAEGGLLWGLAWRCTTGLAYRLRTGLDYETLMRHEHINTAPEILALVRYFFRKVKVHYFPLPLLHFSVFLYIEAAQPDEERCISYFNK